MSATDRDGSNEGSAGRPIPDNEREPPPLPFTDPRITGAYEYWRGFNWLAIGALALGVAPSLPGFVTALRGVPARGMFGTIYNWAWFVGFLLSALVYVIGMRVAARSTEQGAVRAGA